MVGRWFGGGRAFGRNRRGNVAMLWALLGGVLVGLVGLSVDFTRAQAIRAQLQNAADGAALAAARAVDVDAETREQLARAYFDSEAGEYADSAVVTISELENDSFEVHAALSVAGGLSRLISSEGWSIEVTSEAVQAGVNIEVALVLDITGSMAGDRIADLRQAANDFVDIFVLDEQTPYYSKAALAPYSVGVNMAGLADAARGPTTGPVPITGAAWQQGATLNISGVTRANPAVVTSNGHGLQTDDTIWISNVGGMTQLNNRRFTVNRIDGNRFQLRSVNSGGYSNYSSGGKVRECRTNECEVVVSAVNHGFAENANIYVTAVNGMTQINSASNTTWQVTDVAPDTYVLENTNGPTYSAYTNGGNAYCTTYGCQYLRFTNASGNLRVSPITTCVSERTGAQAYTDASPATAEVGRIYAATNSCPTATVTPLTSDRTTLHNRINALTDGGATAGHIGLAWGWYLLSPNFSALFPGASTGAPYDTPETMKIVVLMTDGAFNTAYCNGVVSRDSTSTNASGRINCDATNGDPFAQADQLCTSIKQAGVIVYTVGFGLAAGSPEALALEQCASTPDHAESAENGAELQEAFRSIARSISQLRLTR